MGNPSRRLLREVQTDVVRPVPSSVVGPFIRVWREDYARLSRQQLAIALSHRAHWRVTAHMIREWESGQLPASDEELNALSAVMGRYWLPERTVRQFRRIVDDCIAEGGYPKGHILYEPDALAHARDVDDAVGALVWHATIRLPDLAVLTRLLERIVLRGDGGARSRRLVRKQTVALCLVRAALTQCQEWEGQLGPMARTARVAASFTRAAFGTRGLARYASPLPPECRAAYGEALVDPRGPGPVRRLIALRNQALARGDSRSAAQARFWALDVCPALPRTEAEALRAESPGMVKVAREVSPDGQLIEPFVHLLGDALRDQRLGDTEEYLEQLAHLADAPGWPRAAWLRWHGEVAWMRGDVVSADRHLERAMACAVTAGSWAEEQAAQQRLDALRGIAS